MIRRELDDMFRSIQTGGRQTPGVPPALLRQALELRRTAHDYIIRNPGASLGIALAAGFAIGWLIKRR